MKKIAIYCRVSTKTQEGLNQEIDLTKYCEKKGYEIFKVYNDVISGKSNSRPAFDRMFADAHKGLFNFVLFWSIDRFSRSGTLFTLQKLKELENLDISWKSYQEPYFDSIGQFKDVVLSIMSTLAKMEREKISERTKAGLRRTPNKHKIGKRGQDKKPRRIRSDRGIKRGGNKITMEKSQDLV